MWSFEIGGLSTGRGEEWGCHGDRRGSSTSVNALSEESCWRPRWDSEGLVNIAEEFGFYYKGNDVIGNLHRRSMKPWWDHFFWRGTWIGKDHIETGSESS